jgi:hypothetical protein
MIRGPGGLGASRHAWQKRHSAAEGRTRDLHALLDRAVDAGAAPVEIESALVDLLRMAKRRKYAGGPGEPPSTDAGR